jgi:short-subunit dehydrogenase
LAGHATDAIGLDLAVGGRRPASPLLGRRALVTGASSGIGAATARLLAAHGAQVAAAGRDEEALAKVAADTGGAVVAGDLLDPEVARVTVAGAVSALGGLDLLVSNAGTGWAGRFQDMAPGEIDRLLDVNLRAAGHLVHAALPYLHVGGGRIVLVGSIAGVLAVPGEAWYAATKAGLAAFAEALRAELTGTGIGVTLVTPGVVATRFFDRRNRGYERRRPRPVSPERMASALVTAVERGRDDVVVPGWLRVPAALHGGLPGLYRALAHRLASPPPALRSV